MLARIFASKLSEQGVPGVLIIPPLKGQLAVDALQKVAAALVRRRPQGTKDLLGAMAEIQELIINSFDKPSPEAWEVALDTNLYANKHWDARLGERDTQRSDTSAV